VAPVSHIDGRDVFSILHEAESLSLTDGIDEPLLGELRDCVHRGMEFLDGAYPDGWVDKIDLDTLDLGIACRCIFGQLEGDFWLAVARHGHADINEFGTIRPDWEWTTDHGFSRPTCDDYVGYSALTQVWRAEITVRRLLGAAEQAITTIDLGPALEALDAMDDALDDLVDASV
jgi:hypothetical protein